VIPTRYNVFGNEQAFEDMERACLQETYLADALDEVISALEDENYAKAHAIAVKAMKERK
jgi:hypothetical protein